jgi:hypothetical protein
MGGEIARALGFAASFVIPTLALSYDWYAALSGYADFKATRAKLAPRGFKYNPFRRIIISGGH